VIRCGEVGITVGRRQDNMVSFDSVASGEDRVQLGAIGRTRPRDQSSISREKTGFVVLSFWCKGKTELSDEREELVCLHLTSAVSATTTREESDSIIHCPSTVEADTSLDLEARVSRVLLSPCPLTFTLLRSTLRVLLTSELTIIAELGRSL
jgi:hypothetical protein